jgi:OOP family OmpA-OmpF porin
MRYIFLLFLVGINHFVFAQKLEYLSSAINTEYSELNPIISPDSKTLYFARKNHPSNSFGEKGTSEYKGSQDVWYADVREDGSFSIARRMPNSINKDQFNDLFSITPDGNTILISGVYINGKRENEVGISISKRTKTGWSEPQKVEIPKLNDLCKGQFLTACLSNDGRTLVMAFSEKKNSKEDDLYVSFKDKEGRWSKPENLGDDINTSGIDTTPFLASDNYTLYFSRNRKDGIGGTDIWVSKRMDRSWKKWSKPVNMGDKINTDDNEYSFSIAAAGDYAYLITKKNTVGKQDIVRFRLKTDEKQTETTTIAANGIGTSSPSGEASSKTEIDKTPVNPLTTAPEPVVMIKGKVTDDNGRPVQAKIVYQALPDGEESSASTDPNTGEYTIVLPKGYRYSYRAIAPNFVEIGKNIDLTDVRNFKEIANEELKLIPIKAGVNVPMNNIFFEFGKATLLPDSYPELNRIIDIMTENNRMIIEIEGHTDNVGSDEVNLRISQQRADAVRSYLLSKKVPSSRVSSVGYGKSRPKVSNDTPEGQAQNRRVEFKIVRN